jgi:hypothetical protein
LHSYALRRVNPFRGVVRVVDIGEARALSVDALNWELQVRVERPVGWGSLNLGRTEILYSRYGVWSAAEGLASYPVHPTLERRRVLRMAEQLVEALVAGSDDFPLTDRFEHWLLDGATDQPLALLATATEPPAKHVALHWRAAPNDEPLFGREPCAAIERLVSRRGATSAWFERQGDGGGCRVGTAGAASDFPELLLSEQWPVADAQAVAGYIDWLAPRLLMLPLSALNRQRLEQAASRQPDDVAHFFRLYPTVIDVHLMNSLRIQARLVQAG